MSGFLRFGRRASQQHHPLLSSPGSLLNILTAAPFVMLVTDERGEIVFRNDAAQEMNREVIEAHGPQALHLLRETLTKIILGGTSFPVWGSFEAGDGDNRVSAEVTVNKVPGGYVVTWRDTIVEATRARVTHQLATEVAAEATSLTSLGDRLTTTATDASAQADMVSQGSAEMAESAQAAAISGIVELIGSIAEQQTLIASAVEEQTATTTEMSSGIRSVAESVLASTDAAETVRQAAAQISDRAADLRQLVTKDNESRHVA